MTKFKALDLEKIVIGYSTAKYKSYLNEALNVLRKLTTSKLTLSKAKKSIKA